MNCLNFCSLRTPKSLDPEGGGLGLKMFASTASLTEIHV